MGTASHVQPYLECLAFRVDSEEGSLVYSGDSGGVPDDIIELARSCDVLVHMCHYFSGTEPTALYREACGNHVDCARIAREAGVGTLVLTHVLEQIDRPGVREQIVKEIRDIYDGNVIWGEDLMEIPIGTPRMAKME